MDDESNNNPLTKVVDFKIPLPYLLSAMVAGLWALISMWFTLSNLVNTVDTLKTILNTSITANSEVNADVAMLKYRMTVMDAEMVKMNDIIRNTRSTK